MARHNGGIPITVTLGRKFTVPDVDLKNAQEAQFIPIAVAAVFAGAVTHEYSHSGEAAHEHSRSEYSYSET